MTRLLERLTFDAAASDPLLADTIEEIVVDSSMRVPEMCSITLHEDNPDLPLIDRFRIGDPIKVQIGFDGSGGDVFTGDITALEPNFSAGGKASLMIQAYDKSYRLHRGRKSRTFLQQTDSAIIRTLLSEAGVTPGTVTLPVDVTHVFMMQYNQTNMEWLLMRAEQLGCQVFVSQGKLNFVPATQKTGSPAELTWGDNLLSFRPRVTAVHQSEEVTVHSWDQVQKKEIVSTVTPISALTSVPTNKPGGRFAASAFGVNSPVHIVNMPVQDTNAAKGIATGYISDLDGSFTQAEGVAFGNGAIKVGSPVKINIRESAMTLYSGEYVVSSVRHIYRRTGRWETHFSVHGRRPNSLIGLLDGGDDREFYGNRFNGVVPAIVTNFQDPENLGRIKVKYPWLVDKTGTPIESDWVRIAAPAAGKNRGFYYIPEVDDEVLIAFEHGDPNRPYMIGSLWNKKDPPPKPTNQVNDGSNITERIIKSRSGHIIVLNDTSGQEQILIRDKSEKNEIVIDTKTNSISIRAQQDINIEAGGNINIKAKGMINAESTMDTKIKAGANYSVQATAKAEMKGAIMNLESQGPLTAKGLTAEVSASTMATFKGAAMVVVQGALIKLN
ncbi:MAG: VgrG-related protein [Caldilineaceae bacterium]|nr:VgrG-related protein [Caldilineaceae bacterium]